jgi:hypothetical protein
MAKASSTSPEGAPAALSVSMRCIVVVLMSWIAGRLVALSVSADGGLLRETREEISREIQGMEGAKPAANGGLPLLAGGGTPPRPPRRAAD